MSSDTSRAQPSETLKATPHDPFHAPQAEGDAITLAMRRTLSFPDRRILIGSTPLDAATSTVHRLYLQSDMRVWTMPCPHCREFSEVRCPRAEWPAGIGPHVGIDARRVPAAWRLEQEISRSWYPSERIF